MARREGSELNNLPSTPEAQQLGRILGAISNAQDELKGYVDRIEQAKKSAIELEKRRDAEVESFDTFRLQNQRAKENAEGELKTVSDALASMKMEFDGLESAYTSKKAKLESEITLIMDDLDSSKKTHAQAIKELSESITKMTSQTERIDQENTYKLEQYNIRKAELESLIELKKKEFKELSVRVSPLADKIMQLKGELTLLIDEKKLHTHELKKLEEGINIEKSNIKILKEELVAYQVSEKERINNGLKVEKEKLNTLKDSVSEMTAKLGKAQKEYQEVMKSVADVVAKTESLDKREKSLRKKFEEFGFTW